MHSTPRRWLRSVPFWAWLASILVMGLASACNDAGVPRLVSPEDSTNTDSSKTDDVGFLPMPGSVPSWLV